MSRAVLASDLADFYREIIAPEFDRICDRLDGMDARFDQIDARLPLPVILERRADRGPGDGGALRAAKAARSA